MRQENWIVRKLRKLLDNKIAAVENAMREGLESASTDYCRFFELKAAYLYKGELLRGHYRLLRNKVSRTDDVEDLKRYFGDIAMYHRERLAGGRRREAAPTRWRTPAARCRWNARGRC